MTLILNSVYSVAQFTNIIPGAIVVTERIAIAYIITSLLNKMKKVGLENALPIRERVKTALDNFVEIIVEYIPAVLHSVVYGLFKSLKSLGYSGITELLKFLPEAGGDASAAAVGGTGGGGGPSAVAGGGTGGGVPASRRRKQAGGRRSKRKHAAKKHKQKKTMKKPKRHAKA